MDLVLKLILGSYKHDRVSSPEAIAASEGFNKQGLIAAHRRGAAIRDSTSKSSPMILPSQVIDAVRMPRTVQELKFAELRLNNVHRGRFVAGRLCVPSFRCNSSSITTILEDEQGARAIKLVILIDGCYDEEIEADNTQGALVAVKDPCFKRFGDGTVGLWISNPQDNIVFLSSSSHGWTLFADDYAQLRVRGNRSFSTGHLAEAVDFYSRSIEAAKQELDRIQRKQLEADKTGSNKAVGCTGFLNACLSKLSKSLGSSSGATAMITPLVSTTTETSQKCDQYMAQVVTEALISAYSNRAEALLQLKSYKAALEDSKRALRLNPSHVKSVFRKGKALHSMGMYREAVLCFELALAVSPHDSLLKQALEKGHAACEQQKGFFELSDYFESGFSSQVPSYADYTGPVRVGMSGVAGRGLFVTRDVKAGELLLVSNPMAISRTRSSSAASSEDLECRLWEGATCSWNKDRIKRQLNYLLGGTRQESVPEKELQRPAMLIALFSTGQDEQVKLSEGQLRRIVQYNSFDEQGFATRRQQQQQQQQQQHGCSGLWFLPSFINHSCYPNASRIHIGDAMFIRASRDLRAGDEILHPYTDIICPLSKRREALKAGWGFTCECRRCKVEARFQMDLEGATELYYDLEDLTGSSSAMGLMQSGDILGTDSWAQHYAAECVREMSSVESCVARRIGKLEEQQTVLRASFLLLYLMVATIASPSAAAPSAMLDAVLRTVASVSPGDPQVLKLAVILAKCGGGENATLVATRLCTAIFGGGHSGSAVAAIMRACLRGAIC